MGKVRKMLGSADAPYIRSLMGAIETQSSATISAWCIEYGKTHILPIFEQAYPNDDRPRKALAAGEGYLAGAKPLKAAKDIIRPVQALAKEVDEAGGAQAAVRAIYVCAASIYTPTHALSLAFYGTAAIAYNQVGLLESPEVYDAIAARECAKMEKALRAIWVENEPNPAKINWNC